MKTRTSALGSDKTAPDQDQRTNAAKGPGWLKRAWRRVQDIVASAPAGAVAAVGIGTTALIVGGTAIVVPLSLAVAGVAAGIVAVDAGGFICDWPTLGSKVEAWLRLGTTCAVGGLLVGSGHGLLLSSVVGLLIYSTICGSNGIAAIEARHGVVQDQEARIERLVALRDSCNRLLADLGVSAQQQAALAVAAV